MFGGGYALFCANTYKKPSFFDTAAIGAFKSVLFLSCLLFLEGVVGFRAFGLDVKGLGIVGS